MAHGRVGAVGEMSSGFVRLLAARAVMVFPKTPLVHLFTNRGMATDVLGCPGAERGGLRVKSTAHCPPGHQRESIAMEDLFVM